MNEHNKLSAEAEAEARALILKSSLRPQLEAFDQILREGGEVDDFPAWIKFMANIAKLELHNKRRSH